MRIPPVTHLVHGLMDHSYSSCSDMLLINSTLTQYIPANNRVSVRVDVGKTRQNVNSEVCGWLNTEALTPPQKKID